MSSVTFVVEDEELELGRSYEVEGHEAEFDEEPEGHLVGAAGVVGRLGDEVEDLD